MHAVTTLFIDFQTQRSSLLVKEMQRLWLEQKFLVRQSTPSDYPEIERMCKLTRLATMFDRRASYLAMMRKMPDLFLVAEIDGKIVGAVSAIKKFNMGYVHHLVVHPKYQRRGIGSKLLEEVCTRLCLRRVCFTFLDIDPRANERYRLIKFYNRHGFKLIIGTVFIKKL